MQNTWKDIFTITPQENAVFDITHSEHINTYLNTQQQRLNPYDRVDINRLNGNFYTREIQTEEILRHIKKMKNRAPGSTNITKEFLQRCPPSVITNLKQIFNACLATGYFPNQFKHATIKFIPKSNKAPHNTLNYRPISLLEVPGKILEKNCTEQARWLSFRP